MPRKPKTTTRSYTLGLLAPSDAADWLPLWERLFRTHEAICRGAKEFGELYLNLRGGLPPSLAEPSAEVDETSRRLLQRGARRMLALGWLSVEDDCGAENHPHRIRELGTGESLSEPLAERLLRAVLAAKGVTSENEQIEWVGDCLRALTARIRPDAVWVNRAAAFIEWQRSFGAGGEGMPEQARQILFDMCGEGFVSLRLPEEAATEGDDEEIAEDATGEADDGQDRVGGTAPMEKEVEPSNASRRVFGDLFGGDAAEKIDRARGKDAFAIALRAMLERAEVPSGEAIHAFRAERGLPELDASRPDKFPPEVSSSGAPTTIAKRYRKLLVSLQLWPQSDGENGEPRPDAARKHAKRVVAMPLADQAVRVNCLDLLDACPAAPASEAGDRPNEQMAERVFSPAWAGPLACRVAQATRMPVEAKSLNELKRLMFAVAARRISQTQSWTKRNEFERHVAAAREDRASERLRELDDTGAAQAWFRSYEDRRGEASGSLFGFRITKRMIGECEAVFKAWAGTASAKERDERTANVQAGAEKFGDPRLYADLACGPGAETVWQNEHGADILKEWVKLRQAQFDQQRLKVPRFCHPDPFRHPTWCEFGGSSKPKIWYAWHLTSKPARPEPGGDADGTRRLWLKLPNFASHEAQPVPMRWRCKRLSKDFGGVRDVTEKPIPRADRTGLAIAGLPQRDGAGRRIRYRPAFPFSKDAKGWNARLQADRDALRQLEEQWDSERAVWRDGGKALRGLRWFVTFAPELAMSDGPGRQIHRKLGWKSSPHSDLNARQKRQGRAKLILSRLPGLRILSVDLGHRYAAACAVWVTLTAEEFQKARDEALARHSEGWQVKVSDLYATIEGPEQESNRCTKKARAEGRVRTFRPTTVYRRIAPDTLVDPSTGKQTLHPAPWARLDRQFLVKLPGEEQPCRAASPQELEMVSDCAKKWGLVAGDESKTRRIDELMARAVRIATLALKRHARRAKIAYALDPKTKAIPTIGGGEKGFQIGDESHITFLVDALFDWYNLASESKWDDAMARELWNTQFPGWQIGTPVVGQNEDRSRQEGRKADDELRERLKPLAEHLARADRTALHAAWQERWLREDGPEREKGDFVHCVTRDNRGRRRSTTTATRATGGWHADLRWLTDWIMGWRLQGGAGTAWTRGLGGLSLTRIATMRSLYQLHKAFAMRAKPDKPRGAPEKGETNAGVAQSILDAMERMREQRVKQLASRIASAALGLGGHWKMLPVPARDKAGCPLRNDDGSPRMKDRWVWQEDAVAKYESCHAVVIENLTNYRPEETRTRRENRQLMSWSSSKVKKYLSEACQLHGLHLREVPAGYTSRQDSRTGAPGVRCTDVPVGEFMTAPWWRRQVNIARGKVDEGKGSSRDRYLARLDAVWSGKGATEWRSAPPLRVPIASGELFVSADPRSPAARGMQADLNAAANIGLRALLDPDWTGAWWYVPAELDHGGWRVPAAKTCAGAAWVAHWKGVAQDEHGYSCAGQPLTGADDAQVKEAEEAVKLAKVNDDEARVALRIAKRTKDPAKIAAATARCAAAKKAHDEAKKAYREAKKAATAKPVLNLWRDPVSAEPECFAAGGVWREYAAYKAIVEYRAIELLREQAGLPTESP